MFETEHGPKETTPLVKPGEWGEEDSGWKDSRTVEDNKQKPQVNDRSTEQSEE